MQNTTIQVGTRSTDILSLTLGDYRTATLGTRAEKVSDTAVTLTAITAGGLTINGLAVPASLSDGVSSISADSSALAKANAINKIENQTGVHADIEPAVLTGVSGIGAMTIDGVTRTLTINGVGIGPLNVLAGDSNGALVEAINGKSNQTGVTAALDTDGNLTLTAADGRNMQVVTTGGIGDELGLRADDGDINQIASGKLRLSSNKAFTLDDTFLTLGMAVATQTVSPDPATAIKYLSVADAETASEAIRTLDAALNQVVGGRSALGALYNRLEGLTDTVSRRIEDLSSADSRIRDADFALETARLTQAQILQDAAISMLTQANVTPRKALELLQR
jgi:flagellin